MALERQVILFLQLLLAGFLSMIIGIDRESRDKSAGLRTHMLVGVGACLFTTLSLVAFPNADTSRVAANIVTGIGFLGAGVIFKQDEKNRVRNLTTAASIWVTAGVGMAVGTGAWFLAIAATVTIWFILHIFWRLRERFY